MDIKKIAEQFEAQEKLDKEPTEEVKALIVEKTTNDIIEQPTSSVGDFKQVVGDVKQEILDKATKKIADEKIIDKHAESLKNIADKALEVEAEKTSLDVQKKDAENKAVNQKIRNDLIVLKATAKRLKKEQKQLNKEQKADHKARNNQAKWELYKDKLTKMKYSYVPNPVVLWMLLFFDGVRSFFDGLGTVSTAIVKALKWVLLIGAILIVLFSIPVTRNWITNLLSGGH